MANVSTEIAPFPSEWNARLCEFSNDKNCMCTLNGMLLTNDNENFPETEFLHEEGKTNQDVVEIGATDSIINFLPTMRCC